jgi:hypothetical protein
VPSVTAHPDEGTRVTQYDRVDETRTPGADAGRACPGNPPDTSSTWEFPTMLQRFVARARLLTMTIGPLAVVALVLAAGRRWV